MKSKTVEIVPPTPIACSRWWIVSVLLLPALTWPIQAQAQDHSETDVIRLAKAQDPDLLTAHRAVAVAEAHRLEAGLRPNPSVGWDREHFPGGSAGESEDSLLFSMPIDLSTRRSMLEHLAQSEVAVAGAEAALTQSDVVVRALTLFYHLLTERQRSGIEQRAAERLEEAARVVKSRKQEGKASGYDLARLEVEGELFASTHRQTQARVVRIQAELRSLLGIQSGSVSFRGSLDPNEGLVAQSTERENGRVRPSLRLLRAAASSAGEAGAAASRTWLPTLQISGGPRIGLADKTRYGYVAGLSVEIPLFSRGKELSARADARRRHTHARADAAQRSAQIERARAERIVNAAQQELRRLDESTRDRVDSLERAAESGYREGERSIVEFLDARRIRSTIAVRRLELMRSLKQAEVALRAARGDFE